MKAPRKTDYRDAIKSTYAPDEIIAAGVIAISFVFDDGPVSSLRGWALLYLFMCVALRKYEAILRRNK